MKKLSLAIFLALVACAAYAQGPAGARPGGPGGPGGQRGGGRMDPKKRMEKMKKDLNLSDAQVKKIETLQAAQRPAMEKLMKAPGDRKAKMPQFKKMMEANAVKMKGILSKDQYAKWDKMQQERMKRMQGGGGRGGMRPGGPGAGGPGAKAGGH